MPNKDDEKPKFIPVDDDIDEWFKNPKFVEEYEALADEFAEFDRECAAHAARQKRRKAREAWLRGVMARLRGVGAKLRGAWAYLMRGLDRIAY